MSGVLIERALRNATKAEASAKRYVHCKTDAFFISSDVAVDEGLLQTKMLDYELPGALGAYPLPADAVIVFRTGKSSVARLKKLIQRETCHGPSRLYNFLTLKERADDDVASDTHSAHESEEDEDVECDDVDEEKDDGEDEDEADEEDEEGVEEDEVEEEDEEDKGIASKYISDSD